MTLALNAIRAPKRLIITVAAEPVYNVLNSMAVMSLLDDNPGVSSWLVETRDAMKPFELEHLRLVFWGFGLEGLVNAVEHGAATENFPAYLKALRSLDANALRDSLLYWLVHSPHLSLNPDAPECPIPDLGRLLDDRAYYVDFLRARNFKVLDKSMIQRTFELFNDPPELQDFIVKQLMYFWSRHFSREWARVHPILEASVAALAQIDTTESTFFEAAQAITGRDLRTLFDAEALMTFREIRFIPSRHNGPYIVYFGDDETLNITFGARTPAGTQSGRASLDNAELLRRLDALADETRLDILRTLKERGELGTAEIMDIFDLNKSAASRHLKLLRANELISERREADNKTKFYSINATHFRETIRALETLFIE
jgi:DNA-binding transcriptional ArsR family regulator